LAIHTTSDAVVIVTRETDVHEIETLTRMCRPQPCTAIGPDVFRDLGTNEAALLPGSEESHGQVRRFQLAPRLTSHVRHRAKYLDMPVLDDQAFVFSAGSRVGVRAHSLKEFVGLLAVLPAEPLAEHRKRHDFARWLDDVFRDHGLGAHVRELEMEVDVRDACDIAADVAQAIRARYETASSLNA
jgi:hypothetical protein